LKRQNQSKVSPHGLDKNTPENLIGGILVIRTHTDGDSIREMLDAIRPDIAYDKESKMISFDVPYHIDIHSGCQEYVMILGDKK